MVFYLFHTEFWTL